MNSTSSKTKKKRSNWVEWLWATLGAFVIALIIKLFLFEVFVIPTTSMERTLLVGDYVLMSKIHYGPRLPITPIAFPFSHNELPFVGGKSYKADYQWKYRRLPGLLGIERGDVLVFNYPHQKEPVDRRENFVKRCVGFPGDELKIVNGRILANGEALDLFEDMQFDFNMITKGKRLDREWMQKWEITEGGQRSTKGHYQFSMPPYIADSLSKQAYVKRIERANVDKGVVVENETVFPHRPKQYPWNLDNYGTIHIPKEGDTIALSLKTLPLYQRIIEGYEGHTVQIKDKEIYIDDVLVSEYVIEMDYFFMVGDNRHNSADSRFWGFVPEDHILGKALFLCFSVKPGLKWFHRGGIRWERLFRGI